MLSVLQTTQSTRRNVWEQVQFSENKLRIFAFLSSISEPVLKVQNLISDINQTDDWGYKNHEVTLGQPLIFEPHH